MEGFLIPHFTSLPAWKIVTLLSPLVNSQQYYIIKRMNLYEITVPQWARTKENKKIKGKEKVAVDLQEIKVRKRIQQKRIEIQLCCVL